MKLYNFHSSSASHRVRIGLCLKGIDFEYLPVSLRAGEQHSESYRAFNPQKNVPVLVDGDAKLSQSLAIFEYLEEKYPAPPLYPASPLERARVRSIALHIACEIQPMNNSRVEKHLRELIGLDKAALTAWRQHWIAVGLDAVEAQLADGAGRFCHGDSPTVADCFLIPQVEKSNQSGLDLRRWPIIERVWNSCGALDAFQRAHPRNQPDYRD